MNTTVPTKEQTLSNLSIEALNSMQEHALEAIKKETNVVLIAPTGSGKTLAFLLPLLEFLDPKKSDIQALILAPSRELAMQIEQVFKAMGTGFKVNCCYGGHDIQVEKNNLSQPPAVLIGTPGRIADHLQNGRINTAGIRTFILDEYDKCLEMGFVEEISNIVKQIRSLSKRILTSATPLAQDFKFPGFSNPKVLNFDDINSAKNLTVKLVSTTSAERLDTLYRLICKIGNHPMLVFCNQRETVEELSQLLEQQKIFNNVFHGGLDQSMRERTLIKFRNGSQHIMVTTDLASRGLDIPQIEYIIHYDLPENGAIYTHRNGRTARMNAQGTAYVMVIEKENLPEFLNKNMPFETLPIKSVLPSQTPWVTLYIAAGKKEKISRGDVAGLLMQKGQLDKEDLGLIEVLDHSSYAAVKRSKVNSLLPLLQNSSIKKQKVKMEIAR